MTNTTYQGETLYELYHSRYKIFLSILLELEPTLTIFILSARTLELQNAMNIWISL